MYGALLSLPVLSLAPLPSPVEPLARLRSVLRGSPRLLVKRDDAIAFAFGGNKVRKMQLVAAQARAAGADTLITTGGVQSNHARVTAAVAARMGMRCILVVNGTRPGQLTANARLDALLGAEVRYVGSREERDPAMAHAAANGLQLPLTLAVLYATAVEHGDGAGADELGGLISETNAAMDGNPARGVDETAWLRRFLIVSKGHVPNEGVTVSAAARAALLDRSDALMRVLDAGRLKLDAPTDLEVSGTAYSFS